MESFLSSGENALGPEDKERLRRADEISLKNYRQFLAKLNYDINKRSGTAFTKERFGIEEYPKDYLVNKYILDDPSVHEVLTEKALEHSSKRKRNIEYLNNLAIETAVQEIEKKHQIQKRAKLAANNNGTSYRTELKKEWQKEMLEANQNAWLEAYRLTGDPRVKIHLPYAPKHMKHLL